MTSLLAYGILAGLGSWLVGPIAGVSSHSLIFQPFTQGSEPGEQSLARGTVAYGASAGGQPVGGPFASQRRKTGGKRGLAITANCGMFSIMSDRELVIDLVSKLPEDTPLAEIAREIELLAGLREARAQARRGEGIPVADARKLVEAWASQ